MKTKSTKKVVVVNQFDIRTVELDIEGMTCDHCAQTVEKQFTGNKGIIAKEVSYPTGSGQFTFDPGQITREQIIATINATGHYTVAGEVEPEFPSDNSFDLIIVGGGSGAFAAAITAGENGAKVAIINAGLPIGGTCVNVGCVPSKNLIRAAETLHRASASSFKGIRFTAPKVSFREIIQNKNELVGELRQKKYLDVVKDKENIRIIEGWARFLDKQSVLVNGSDIYRAGKMIVATGSTTLIPGIEGLKESGYLTHQTLFDMEELPESMTILSAGYIGLEIGMAFNRFGSSVRILEFTNRPLRSQTADISNEIMKHMKAEGIQFFPDHRIQKIEIRDGVKVITGTDKKKNEAFEFFEKGAIVVATGIIANTAAMNLEEIGVSLDEKGSIIVNEKQETSVEDIFAVGDCINTPSFVYTAAAEGKTAAMNAMGKGTVSTDYKGLPWVVFTDPQVAGAGMDELQAAAAGVPFETATVSLADVPRAIAALDTRGFIKLIRNPETDELLGIRVVAPEGGELVMQVSLAIKFGVKAEELANSLFPYLTLSEGVKLAAIAFHKDVKELSCCAV